MATLAVVRAAVRGMIQDDAAFLTEDEVDVQIGLALAALNSDRPLLVRSDYNGDGSSDYALGDTTYIDGESVIRSVEYPAGETPPTFLPENDDWFYYYDPSKTAGSRSRIRFKQTVPQIGEKIRVTFEAEWTLTSAASNLTGKATCAVETLSAAYALRSLAAHFGQTMNPTISADVVDYGARVQGYLFLSERYRSEYKKLVGLEGVEIKAAQAMGDVDLVFSSGEDLLWHPKTSR